MIHVTKKINNAGGIFNPGKRNTLLKCEQTGVSWMSEHIHTNLEISLITAAESLLIRLELRLRFHLVSRWVLVDRITRRRGRHILIYTCCFILPLLPTFNHWFLRGEGLWASKCMFFSDLSMDEISSYNEPHCRRRKNITFNSALTG